MQKLGIRTGKDLKDKKKPELIRLFGKNGSFFHDICRGIDNRPVNPERIRKSIGKERTFEEDLASLEEINDALRNIADLVCSDLKRFGIKGKTLTLKVKYNDFRQITRSRTFQGFFNDDKLVRETAEEIMEAEFYHGNKIRLLGITLSNLESAAGIPEEGDKDQLTFDF